MLFPANNKVPSLSEKFEQEDGSREAGGVEAPKGDKLYMLSPLGSHLAACNTKIISKGIGKLKSCFSLITESLGAGSSSWPSC